MTILMDKMKEHSCAIQPAFGYGGGGLGLNFALMFDQVFNVEPIISPVEDDEPIEPPAFLQQVDNLFNAANQQQPPLPPGIPPYSQLYTAAGEEVQNVTEGNQSVAELVANAVQQHIATHHAAFQGTGTTNDSNNSHHPVINVAETIFNAIEESLSAAIPSTTHVIAIPVGGFQLPAAGPNQAQSNTIELSNSTPTPQQSSALSYYLGIPFPSSPDFSFIDSLNDTHNSASSLPPDEESNSSNPAIQAPVSSPIHLPSSSNLSSAASSDDDDIIMLLDSVEDEESNEEN